MNAKTSLVVASPFLALSAAVLLLWHDVHTMKQRISTLQSAALAQDQRLLSLCSNQLITAQIFSSQEGRLTSFWDFEAETRQIAVAHQRQLGALNDRVDGAYADIGANADTMAAWINSNAVPQFAHLHQGMEMLMRAATDRNLRLQPAESNRVRLVTNRSTMEIVAEVMAEASMSNSLRSLRR